MQLKLNENEMLALRNCILPRLVDLEQHGYSEEFEGESVALRILGDKLERNLSGRSHQMRCSHGITFDAMTAQLMTSSADVRARWPRFEGKCTKCGFQGVDYVSPEHCIMGGWDEDPE